MSKIIRDGGSNVIGVFSGKGGVGKTTVVSNLGAALASEFNKKVLVVDSNVKTSHLGLHLGVYEELPVTLKEVLLKKSPVLYAIFLHPETGMRLLPAPLKGDMDLKSIDGVVKELKATYDPIIVDCAPGLGKDVVITAKGVDKALLVTTPDLPSITDLLKTINLLKKLKKDIIGIVLNRVRGEKYELSVEEIESTCGYDVIAVIPESNRIPQSIADGIPLTTFSSCPVSIEFKGLAASLIGMEYKPAGFWYRLKHLFSIRSGGNSRRGRGGKGELTREKLIEEQLALEKLKEELREELMRREKLRSRGG